MKIIVGLGNPGEQYLKTRHNVGFWAIDALAERLRFPSFRYHKAFSSDISERIIEKEKVILAKPQTFMNESGTAVRALLSFYKQSPNVLLVIHDDLDIELGKYKMATESSSAGHHGVQDIIDTTGTQAFRRIRIGIGKSPQEKLQCAMPGKDYVLQKVSREEEQYILDTIHSIIVREFSEAIV